MNRNVESHFSMLPSANISRSRFDRSQDIKFTGNVGDLIPFFVDEVLPGDTFDITSSKVVRLQTLLTPIMDNMYLDTYWFFVPNRLVWDHWRELMGENRQSAWIPEVEYSVPQIKFIASSQSLLESSGVVKTGDILDYMGVPVGVGALTTAPADEIPTVSALPLRGYQLIYNEFFRSENIIDPVNIQTGDSDVIYSNLLSQGLTKPFKVAKYFDYFTSCLPSPQKGPPVSVPAGFNVDIGSGWPVSTPSRGVLDEVYKTDAMPLSWRYAYGSDNAGDPVSNGLRYTNSSSFLNTSSSASPGFGRVAADGNNTGIYPSNLFAAPGSNQATGLSIDVNDLRYAFQLQKLYERDARGGTRYTELLQSHFGVSNPDARMQRPEYLGGNRVSVSIHQITNQSQGERDFLGDVGAMSLTTDKHNDFVKSFTEHGFVFGLCCIRYDHSYSQGLNKMWTRKNRFDYYWPVFANLGEQAVKKSEIYWTGSSTDNDVFGYQERWAEYRYSPNRVAGEMRPGISNTLDSWHLGDYYTEVPTLSEGWLNEDKTTVDRVLAVQSSVSNQFFADIYVKNFTTRPMPLYSIPGLIDHH